MPTLIAGIIAVVLIYAVLQAYRNVDPRVLARAMKVVGGIVALAMAAFTGVRGEIAVAVPLGLFGLGLLGWAPFAPAGFSARTTRSGGSQSTVRSAFLEMTLDHDSGRMAGTIMAGARAGQSLDALDLAALLALLKDFDDDSRALLAGYLDRRFPAWREHAQGDAAEGSGRTASTGKMTEEEAYQILGLKPGAGRAEITHAHRTLMKKLHPDQGGSTYLAARVNAAKDFLLRRHRS